MSLLDLAEIDCRTDDVKMYLVKLIETAIHQTTSKNLTPLSSLLPYLFYIENRKEFLGYFDYVPLDFTIIRFRLLRNKYDSLSYFAKDVDSALLHYENIRDKYGMPDVGQMARDIIIQGLNNLPFTQFLQQPLDFDMLLQQEIKQSVKCLSIKEATTMLYLIQDFDSTQMTTLEQFCVAQKIVVQDKVEVSRIPPRAARHLFDFVKRMALPTQISATRRRIEVVDNM